MEAQVGVSLIGFCGARVGGVAYAEEVVAGVLAVEFAVAVRDVALDECGELHPNGVNKPNGWFHVSFMTPRDRGRRKS